MKKMHVVNIAGKTAISSEMAIGEGGEQTACGGVPWR